MGGSEKQAVEQTVSMWPPTAFGTVRQTRKDAAVRLTGAVDVVVDNASHIGLLSYLVPDNMTVYPGDAVTVPFGRTTSHGMVVRNGDPAKATREILEVHGTRSDPSDVAVALSVADYHFVPPGKALSRLAPNRHRGASVWEPSKFELRSSLHCRQTADTGLRRVVVPRGSVGLVEQAVCEAKRLSSEGQVLIVCPTADYVEEVLELSVSGVARLDSQAPRGAWKSFCEGTLPVGVGTRSCVMYAAANLAGIVVIDDGHPGHREPRSPHTNARDLASARARSHRIPLVTVTEAPTPQTLDGSTNVTELGPGPKVNIVDRTAGDPMEALVPRQLRSLISRAQRRNEAVLVVAPANVSVRRCVRCGTPRPCAACNDSLCRHSHEDTPCPGCSVETKVKMTGWDADRVRKLLGSDVEVMNVKDLPSSSGTRTIVMFDFDSVLHIPDVLPEYSAARQVSRCVAAAGPKGNLILCTSDAKNRLLRDLASGRGTIPACRRALAAAKANGLPPFGRLVRGKVTRKSPPNLDGWPGRVNGPSRNGTQWEFIVRIPTSQLLKLAPYIAKLRRGGKAQVIVE